MYNLAWTDYKYIRKVSDCLPRLQLPQMDRLRTGHDKQTADLQTGLRGIIEYMDGLCSFSMPLVLS